MISPRVEMEMVLDRYIEEKNGEIRYKLAKFKKSMIDLTLEKIEHILGRVFGV